MTRVLLLLLVVFMVIRLVRSLLAPSDRARPDARPAWDPYLVLGIARGASRDEIAHAYREQLKRYHPDRVADLGPELQQVAHRMTVDLQRAYSELTR